MPPTVVQILNTSLAELSRADRTDGQLLDLFVNKHDHEAFASLVRRHGPMVLGVCRRVLQNAADADDAFQAAFLVLARKAASLGRRELLPAWLHGVAFNTARKLRHANTRRLSRETPIAGVPEPPAAEQHEPHAELLAVLDEELARLPERYRAPILLCDLQGATRKEAAAMLGCPEGTVAGRLARARAMLAQRLADRGVAPAAGVLAVLTDRAAAAALVGNVLRGVAEGVVSSRVAGLTEGVLSAMFAKKLRMLAAVGLFAGLVFAGAVGLFQAATAQTDPRQLRIPLGEKTDPKPAARVKIFTAVPLKNMEDEGRAVATAVIESGLYRGGSNFAMLLVEQKVMLIYADEETTKVTLTILRKLGEEPGKIPTVFHLSKDTDVKEVANTLTEAFGGLRRVWIYPVPNDSVLLVYATPADTLTIHKLIGKAEQGEPVPVKGTSPTHTMKRYTVSFKNAAWADVLEWYAKESGLTPAYTVKPMGTVTLMPPKDRQFTLGEVTDLLNEALIQQRFILIRRDATFLLHPSDEKIDPTMIPRIKLEELPERGKTEIVQVLLPLKDLAVEDVAPEVQKMLTPFGAIASLKKTNVLVIQDTAGNINRIMSVLRAPEDPDAGDKLTYRVKSVKAKELAEKLKTLIPGVADEGGKGYDPRNDPRNDPRRTGRVESVRITWDEQTNTLYITAPPDKLALAKKLIEELDKPSRPSIPGASPFGIPPLPNDPELRKYSVPAGTADAIARSLQTEYPEVRLLSIPTSNEIIVLATPVQHILLAAKLKTLTGPRAIPPKNREEQPKSEEPAPKKFSFEMQDTPWEDVLEWYAKQSGLTPIYTVKPKGHFMFIPPKDAKYTIVEITDILNEQMANQMFMLVRRSTSFTIVPADEKLDPSMFPRVKSEDLPQYGKTEIVQVLIPLKTLPVEDVVPDVEKLLSRQGAVAQLSKTNTLVVVDTAGNLRRIAKLIEEIDVADTAKQKDPEK